MAFLEDMMERIPDPALRQLIQTEVRKLKNTKKFGLVFEQHLPEVVPLYSARIQKGTRIAPAFWVHGDDVDRPSRRGWSSADDLRCRWHLTGFCARRHRGRQTIWPIYPVLVAID